MPAGSAPVFFLRLRVRLRFGFSGCSFGVASTTVAVPGSEAFAAVGSVPSAACDKMIAAEEPVLATDFGVAFGGLATGGAISLGGSGVVCCTFAGCGLADCLGGLGGALSSIAYRSAT